MNDLEPWKIWSVTGILVLSILGTAAMKVRPFDYGPTAAGAAEHPPIDQSDAHAPELASQSDGNDAYSQGSSTGYRSFHSSYTQPQVSAAPFNRSLNAGSALSPFVDNSTEPELTISQQVVATDLPQDDNYSDFAHQQVADAMVDWLDNGNAIADLTSTDEVDGEGLTFPIAGYIDIDTAGQDENTQNTLQIASVNTGRFIVNINGLAGGNSIVLSSGSSTTALMIDNSGAVVSVANNDGAPVPLVLQMAAAAAESQEQAIVDGEQVQADYDTLIQEARQQAIPWRAVYAERPLTLDD